AMWPEPHRSAARGHFAYSVLCEVASESERQSITGIISEAVMPKRSEQPDPGRAGGGGASDFGITYPNI
ncbi:hypothetical protein KKF23_03280, partial [Patescibacteria group bacterium]|nr:hypothetical protein [Patescibacteria group bacterium]